jgi:hypothetical protein
MELVYLKERMWCIYIHHRVWICYPNVVRRYGRYLRYPCRGGLACACQEMGKHVGLPLTVTLLKSGLAKTQARTKTELVLDIPRNLHLRCLYLMGVALSQACILEAATSGIQTQEISPVPKHST